jgi:glycosyltransferase involved in cell wall biosynthesis
VNTVDRLRVWLVDPSLFTAPYDAALTDGLLAADVEPMWAVRPVRPGDRQEIASEHVDAFFYRHVERMSFVPSKLRALAKGMGHALGLARLVFRVLKQRPDAVHFQWLVVPPLDSLAIVAIRSFVPVLLTVHDTVPFNGEYVSFWQNLAFDLPLKLSDGIVVHTHAGRETLLRRGVADSKVSVIPHGPLPLHGVPRPQSVEGAANGRFTFTLFGELKTYKGIDVLVEALGMLPASVRANAHFIVAGRPRMDLSKLRARIAQLGLNQTIELLAQRLSEQEMTELFARSDCFLFPYRQIDASGVYFLVKSLGKWLIASNIGIFAEDVRHEQGELVPVEDARALADAIARAIAQRPKPEPVEPGLAWALIGEKTRALYLSSRAKRAAARGEPSSSVASTASEPSP